MVDRFEQFTSAISSIYRFVQKIERDVMEKFGLKGAYAQYLLALANHSEGLTAAALCEVCDKDKSAVSRILTEMEAKGLVLRTSENESQYRARLILTEQGKKAVEYVRQKATVAVELAGKGLTEENRGILYGSLALIAGNLETIAQNGVPDELS